MTHLTKVKASDAKPLENLHCNRCVHQVTTRKTLGMPGEKLIACPKCQAKQPLDQWRAPKPPELPVAPQSIDNTPTACAEQNPSKVALFDKALDSIGMPAIIGMWIAFMFIGGIFLAAHEYEVTALALVLSTPCVLTTMAIRKSQPLWIGLLVLFVGIVGAFSLSRYVIPDIRTFEQNDVSYTDYYTGWGKTHYYREFKHGDLPGSNEGGLTRSEGGMSETGKPHGKWETSFLGTGRFDRHTTWYWYGEVIDEGEWHLRNR